MSLFRRQALKLLPMIALTLLWSCVPKPEAKTSASAILDTGACPSGFTKVPRGSTGLVVSDFCVMTTEARRGLDGSVSTEPTLYPWTSASAATAKARCRALGENYDLISNDEWMAIARDLELVGQNWTSGIVGTGKLFIGNATNYPLSVLNIFQETNSWDQMTVSSGETRRTLILSNGETLWDFSGNASEIVDWGKGATYSSPPTCDPTETGVFRELEDVSADCGFWLDLDRFRPSIFYQSASAMNYGAFSLDSSAAQVLTRGGGVGKGNQFTQKGIFNIHLTFASASSSSSPQVSFRCVYRGI